MFVEINKPATKLPAGNSPKGCGLPYFRQNLISSVTTKIIGGSEAVPYSYPWIGKLTYTSASLRTFCAASLIMGFSSTESDLVITAAHCVLNV